MHIVAGAQAIVFAQFQDGVAHQLAGAMVGHVPPSLNALHLNSLPVQPLLGSQDVRGIGSTPQRDDGCMLEQEQNVLDQVALAQVDEGQL